MTSFAIIKITTANIFVYKYDEILKSKRNKIYLFLIVTNSQKAKLLSDR